MPCQTTSEFFHKHEHRRLTRGVMKQISWRCGMQGSHKEHTSGHRSSNQIFCQMPCHMKTFGNIDSIHRIPGFITDNIPTVELGPGRRCSMYKHLDRSETRQSMLDRHDTRACNRQINHRTISLSTRIAKCTKACRQSRRIKVNEEQFCALSSKLMAHGTANAIASTRDQRSFTRQHGHRLRRHDPTA